jgi:hypothetical protein
MVTENMVDTRQQVSEYPADGLKGEDPIIKPDLRDGKLHFPITGVIKEILEGAAVLTSKYENAILGNVFQNSDLIFFQFNSGIEELQKGG